MNGEHRIYREGMVYNEVKIYPHGATVHIAEASYFSSCDQNFASRLFKSHIYVIAAVEWFVNSYHTYTIIRPD